MALMTGGSESFAVGRLTRDGVTVGYLAVDSQRWSFTRRKGLTSQRWSEVRRRYRLDLLGDWDEGFLEPEDEADLEAGRFRFKGEVLAYEKLADQDMEAVRAERFSGWV